MAVVVREGSRLAQLTTETLILEEMASQGLELQNLYQPFEPDESGFGWVCNVRELNPPDPNHIFSEFGVGDTWREAIFVALHNAYYSRNKSFMWAKQKILRGRNHSDLIWPNTCDLDKAIKVVYYKGFIINWTRLIEGEWHCNLTKKDQSYTHFWQGRANDITSAIKIATTDKNPYIKG